MRPIQTGVGRHDDALPPFKKGPVPRRIGRAKWGYNSRLHPVCDCKGRPLVTLLSEGK